MDLDVMANEEWETIKDFPNYQVSTFGNIRSVDRISVRNGNECHLSGMLLKPRNVKGYLRVVLYNGTRNKKKAFLVHRLVADAFLDNPTQLPCVNHKDENGLNNRLDNLEWCDHRYNSNYGTAIKRRVEHQNWDSIAQKQAVRVKQKDRNGIVVKIWDSMMDCERNGFKCSGVSRCCAGHLKTYRGFHWEKEEKE